MSALLEEVELDRDFGLCQFVDVGIAVPEGVIVVLRIDDEGRRRILVWFQFGGKDVGTGSLIPPHQERGIDQADEIRPGRKVVDGILRHVGAGFPLGAGRGSQVAAR